MKTRTIAAEIIAGGKLRVNGTKVTKGAHVLAVGDVLTLAYGGQVRLIRVVDFADRRGSAGEAQLLYEEIEG